MRNSVACPVCGGTKNPTAHFCKRCRKIIDRPGPRRKKGDVVIKPNKDARRRALKKAWDGEGFRCYYSDIRLIEDNPKDTRYWTFDHRTPRNESDVVVAASLINDMKSDMTESEFKKMVIQLASHFKGGSFDNRVFNLKHWKR